MKTFTFQIHREPWTTTAQQKRMGGRRPSTVLSRPGRVLGRTGGVRFFHTSEYQAAEKELVLALTGQKTRQGIDTIRQACRVRVELLFPYRAAEKAAIRKAGIPVPHTVRPDLDNLSKLYLDALVKSGWIEDDSLIYVLTLEKWRVAPDEVGIRYAIFTT